MRDQFKTMVTKCRQAGVKVYVDAVINHTDGPGAHLVRRRGLHAIRLLPTTIPDDFHFKVGECPSGDGGIQDFNNKLQVFKCNLVGLEDLRTETDKVQDAAGRVPEQARSAMASRGSGWTRPSTSVRTTWTRIYSRLNKTKDGVKPYWALEVFGGGPGILSPEAFTRSGDVLGSRRGEADSGDAFKSYPRQRQHRQPCDTRGVRRRIGPDIEREDACPSSPTTTPSATQGAPGLQGRGTLHPGQRVAAGVRATDRRRSSRALTWATTRRLTARRTATASSPTLTAASGAWTCDHRNRGIVGDGRNGTTMWATPSGRTSTPTMPM